MKQRLWIHERFECIDVPWWKWFTPFKDDVGETDVGGVWYEVGASLSLLHGGQSELRVMEVVER